MHEVPAVMARAAFELARQAGLPLDELCSGLPTIKARRHIAWDDYCLFYERVQAAVGGSEQFADLTARSYHSAVPREGQVMFGAFLSPRLIYRFIFKVLQPSFFPFVAFGFTDLAGGSLRLTCRMRSPDVRPSRAIMSGTAGALRGIPCYLGLPMAEVEVEELTERSLVAVVRPPQSRTLAARAGRAAAPGFKKAALRMMEIFARQPAAAVPEARAATSPPHAAVRVEELRRTLSLTDRQAQVLAQVVAGRSNKEIAAALDCAENTVEFHVTQLLRKAGVDSRTLLIAQFWAGSPRA